MVSNARNVEELITEITMSRDGVAWLIVEGETDLKCLRYRPFPCRVNLAVGHGWEGVRDVLAGVDKAAVKCALVGVMDRDYRSMSGQEVSGGDVVLTDLRDLELMLFWSNAVERVLREIGASGKLPTDAYGTVDIDRVRSVVVEAVRALGRFRAFCYVKRRQWDLSDLNYAKFVCEFILRLDAEKLMTHLSGRNRNQSEALRRDWEAAQNDSEFSAGAEDAGLICHGHDVMAVLALSLRRLWGSRQLAREEIEEYMRIAYSDEELARTKMWREICRRLTGAPIVSSLN